MTSTPVRSGMPGHFGIRITDADKDKLVGELDVDDRHLNNSGHVYGGALAAFADDLGGALAGLNVPPGFGQPRSSRRRISFAPACRGGLPALLSRSMWGVARSSRKPRYTAPMESLPR
jgi:acyl-coenzyme A thioesterase PaaI-like protein